MQAKEKKKIMILLILSLVAAVTVFVWEYVSFKSDIDITRNTYGEGTKTEEYELTIPGIVEKERIQIETEEQEYTHEEIKDVFREMMEALDTVILDKNESFDRVETNLNLVSELPGYPVRIQWELDSYEVMNLQGEIQQDKVIEKGTLVEVRGTLSYGEEEAVYVRTVMVYPVTREGTEKFLYEVQQAVKRAEEASREKASFSLPQTLEGRELQWSRKKEGRWRYILLLGIVYAVFLIYKSREKVKQAEKRRKEALLRDYPDMVSKFTMLISTGTTVRGAWEKIVQNYENQKETLGVREVYEEMGITLHEIQSGTPEAEAYENFGKRTGVNEYIKFGALLSQNLRKGSKGLADILRMEAAQSFENRKSRARRLGEEAGMKLLMPMLGMLAVVLIMVMVPAFLTMQL